MTKNFPPSKTKQRSSLSVFGLIALLAVFGTTFAFATNPYVNRGEESNLAPNFQGDGPSDPWLAMQLRNGAAFDWPGEARPRLLVTFDQYFSEPNQYWIGSERPAEVYVHDNFFSQYPVFNEEPVDPSLVWDDGNSPGPNTTGAIFADFNNDGYQDAFAPNPDGHALYRFDPEDNVFVDVTGIISYLPASEFNETITASWGDYDGDGFVDLFVSSAPDDWSAHPDAVRLFRNVEGTAFVPVSDELEIHELAKDILTPLWADFDGDHDVDLLMVQSSAHEWSYSFYLENQIHDAAEDFVDTPGFISACAGAFANPANIAVCNDFNNDGLLDVAHYHRHGFGVFTLKSDLSGFEEYADYQNDYPQSSLPLIFDLAAFDADHDGDIDLLTSMQRESLAHTQRWPRLHFQVPGSSATTRFSTYEDFSSDAINYGHDGKGICAADFTMDGLTELFFTRDVGPTDPEGDFFFDLDNSMEGNWVGVKLEALGNLCNRDCLGATVIVTSTDGTTFTQAQVVDGGSGRASQNRPWLSFGLGDYTGNVDIEVRLPNRGVIPGGSTFSWEDVVPGQYHELTMASIPSDEVQITLSHEVYGGTVKMQVDWTTSYPTAWQEDAVVFHTDAADAIDPGTLEYHVTQDPGYGSTGPYAHSLVITGLPCDSSQKYYIHIENRAVGAMTTQFSSIFDSQTTKCLSNGDPGDIPDNPLWP